jgi:hypothetical protein
VTRFAAEFNDNHKSAADGRLDAPAFHRNHQAIWSVLAGFLRDKTGDVLEIGSGTGQHSVEFARSAPNVVWWPSDYQEPNLTSIAAWGLRAKLPNLRAPARIDVSDPCWNLPPELRRANKLLAIFCANVVHIAPWRVAEGLFSGAGRHLGAGAWMFLYGPFMRQGRHTAPSNVEFDLSLRGTNPEWGVRDTVDLASIGARQGLQLIETVEMPANNLILVFERSACA